MMETKILTSDFIIRQSIIWILHSVYLQAHWMYPRSGQMQVNSQYKTSVPPHGMTHLKNYLWRIPKNITQTHFGYKIWKSILWNTYWNGISLINISFFTTLKTHKTKTIIQTFELIVSSSNQHKFRK